MSQKVYPERPFEFRLSIFDFENNIYFCIKFVGTNKQRRRTNASTIHNVVQI